MQLFAFTIRTLLVAGLFLWGQNRIVLAQENLPPLTVAVSVKPLHSLISGLMEGTGIQPSLIVSGGASPHAYNLKPSDARKLNAARLIFWIGPDMEGFLVKPLRALAGTTHIVSFLAQRTASGNGHDHQGPSPHIWLSPIRAGEMVQTAAARLIAVDPGNADLYRRNAAKVGRRLDDLQAEMAALLEPVKSTPFVVYHDAYDHLADAFGLNISGVVTITPERAPGARHIGELRERMTAGRVSCLFAEPQVDRRRLNVIVEHLKNVRIGVLDPLGVDIAAGKDMYFTLMRANARALVDCLTN